MEDVERFVPGGELMIEMRCHTEKTRVHPQALPSVAYLFHSPKIIIYCVYMTQFDEGCKSYVTRALPQTGVEENVHEAHETRNKEGRVEGYEPTMNKHRSGQKNTQKIDDTGRKSGRKKADIVNHIC